VISVSDLSTFLRNILLIIKYVKKTEPEMPEKNKKSSDIPVDFDMA